MRPSNCPSTFWGATCCRSDSADLTLRWLAICLTWRGVASHLALMFLAAIAIMFAGKYGGIAGTVTAGLLLTVVLLGGRVAIASLTARLEFDSE